MARRRQTWRASPLTLAIVITFAVVSAVGIPAPGVPHPSTASRAISCRWHCSFSRCAGRSVRLAVRPPSEDRCRRRHGVRVVNPFRRPGSTGTRSASCSPARTAWWWPRRTTGPRRGASRSPGRRPGGADTPARTRSPPVCWSSSTHTTRPPTRSTAYGSAGRGPTRYVGWRGWSGRPARPHSATSSRPRTIPTRSTRSPVAGVG